MKWLLLASLVLVGCATPSGVTPKPDIRPVIVSHQKAQASVGKSQKYVSQIKSSQAKVGESIQKAVSSLDKFTGASTAVEDAKKSLADAQNALSESQGYAAWADTELGNAWRYEADTGEKITTLSGQIDQAHKHEQELADYEAKTKPVIDQVNKWWGLGAFVYGAKVLSRHLFILAAVVAVIALALFALSFFFPAIGLAFGAVRGVLNKVVNIIKRR
jgi:hypothetical protein